MAFRSCIKESGIFSDSENILNDSIKGVEKNQENLKNLRNTINSFKNSYKKNYAENTLKLYNDRGIFYYIDKERPITLDNNGIFKYQKFEMFIDSPENRVINLNNNFKIGINTSLNLINIYTGRKQVKKCIFDDFNLNLNLNNNILTLKDNYKLYFSNTLLSNKDSIVKDNDDNTALFYNIDEKKFFIIYEGMNLYINENNDSELLYYIIIYPKKYFFNKELILTQESLIRYRDIE